MKVNRPKIVDVGIYAEHNHACSVCALRKSVLDLNNQVFQPCWKCQDAGWTVIKRRRNLGEYLRGLRWNPARTKR